MRARIYCSKYFCSSIHRLFIFILAALKLFRKQEMVEKKKQCANSTRKIQSVFLICVRVIDVFILELNRPLEHSEELLAESVRPFVSSHCPVAAAVTAGCLFSFALVETTNRKRKRGKIRKMRWNSVARSEWTLSNQTASRRIGKSKWNHDEKTIRTDAGYDFEAKPDSLVKFQLRANLEQERRTIFVSSDRF